MNIEFVRKWVADLRQGPAQTQGCLYDGSGYCCLGRAEIVAGSTFEENEEGDGGTYDFSHRIFNTDESTSLTARTIALGGFHSSVGARSDGGLITIAGKHYVDLTAANDKGVPFSQIADYIEANHEFL